MKNNIWKKLGVPGIGLLVLAALIAGCAARQDAGQQSQPQESKEADVGKYGQAVPHLIYRAFTPTVSTDDEEREQGEKTLVVLTMLSVSASIENAVNDYIQERGYDFEVDFVSPDFEALDAADGFVPLGDFYEQRREAGLQADIFEAASVQEGHDFQYFVDQGYLLKLDSCLETETGAALLQEMNLFFTDTDDTAMRDAYIDALRASDGGAYRLPTYFDYNTPYRLYYVKGYADYYGLSWTGTLQDIEQVIEQAERLRSDGIAPIALRSSNDCASLNLGGYEAFDYYWALYTDETGKTEAVDFLENDELCAWYAKLGQYRADGYLTYTSSIRLDDLEYDMEVDACTETMVELELGAYMTSVGMNADEYGNYYDAYPDMLSDVTTYADFADNGISVSADTEYPEECMEFLYLYYSDMAFRNLLYYGIEGKNYYIDEESYGEAVMVCNTTREAMIDYELYTSYRAMAELPIAFYQENYRLELQEKSCVKLSSIPAKGFDVTAVQEQYDACMQLYDDYLPAFLGYYGTETSEKLEELHQQLLDAGLNEVLECINSQLE